MADGAHILGHHVAAAFNERVGFCGFRQTNAGTRRTAKANHLFQIFEFVFVGVTCSEHNINNITLDFLVHIDVFHNLARLDNLVGRENLVGLRECALNVLTHNELLFFLLRVADNHLEHKTVHLRLGQRISSLLLNRVLSGHYKERLFELEGGVANGDLLLLHRLEQCTLYLCRGTVNLIGQNKVCENRAFLYAELLGFGAVNHCSNHIGRQQIGCELDSAEPCVDCLRQRVNCQCLGQSWKAFKKNVPIGQQANQQTFSQMLLTHNHLVHLHSD